MKEQPIKGKTQQAPCLLTEETGMDIIVLQVLLSPGTRFISALSTVTGMTMHQVLRKDLKGMLEVDVVMPFT